jgi:hypothetical protein
MPGLVPGIRLSASVGACGTMDPGDKHRDDNRIALTAHRAYRPLIAEAALMAVS